MNVAFILTMPNVGSWNGKWTGDRDCYAVIRALKPKLANTIIARCFSYNFGDGWRAEVEVRAVDAAESKRLRKASRGFCDYEWMIDSIVSDAAIYGPTQPKPATEPCA